MSQVSVAKITESESHVVVSVQIQGDGTGELNKFVILSPADLVPARRNVRATFRIMEVWYGLVWFDVVLGFGTVLPQQAWTLARDGQNHACLEEFGGMLDPAALLVPPPDDDGKLWISTNSLVLGSKGSIVLDLQKTNAP